MEGSKQLKEKVSGFLSCIFLGAWFVDFVLVLLLIPFKIVRMTISRKYAWDIYLLLLVFLFA